MPQLYRVGAMGEKPQFLILSMSFGFIRHFGESCLLHSVFSLGKTGAWLLIRCCPIRSASRWIASPSVTASSFSGCELFGTRFPVRCAAVSVTVSTVTISEHFWIYRGRETPSGLKSRRGGSSAITKTVPDESSRSQYRKSRRAMLERPNDCPTRSGN
jgi:hypothetical protein